VIASKYLWGHSLKMVPESNGCILSIRKLPFVSYLALSWLMLPGTWLLLWANGGPVFQRTKEPL
jgi:hypothetical protein